MMLDLYSNQGIIYEKENSVTASPKKLGKCSSSCDILSQNFSIALFAHQE